MAEKKEVKKEYDPLSYSWANRCLLIAIGLIVLGFIGVPLVHIVGIAMLLGCIVLYIKVSVTRRKTKQ